MNSFMNEDFLLTTDTARRLFHEVAEELPIIDFHNHLDPKNLAMNHSFADLAEIWITSDPYKHRMMRIAGIDEEIITGKQTSGKQRYQAWAALFPKTMGSPLFHWSCLELKRFFGVDALLNSDNAKAVWESCNHTLQQPGWGMLDILKKCRTEMLCTSDDLLADLTPHQEASRQPQGIRVKPSLRADAALNFEPAHFAEYVARLSMLTGLSIHSLEEYLQAIELRLQCFEEAGCEYADHSLDSGFHYLEVSREEAEVLFTKVQVYEAISQVEAVKLQSYILRHLGCCYARRNWCMQLHIGAKRNTNSRLRAKVGPAGGYASIGSACDIDSLAAFLDALDKDDLLPRTILYTLNPADNAAFATLTGSYSGSGVRGKVQFGSAWWYNDHLEGMEKQLQALASYGQLSSFVGMTTDSRSVLSFSRHEYFRRVLCRFIGEKVECGEFPTDFGLLGEIIKGICYENSKNWRKQL